MIIKGQNSQRSVAVVTLLGFVLGQLAWAPSTWADDPLSSQSPQIIPSTPLGVDPTAPDPALGPMQAKAQAMNPQVSQKPITDLTLPALSDSLVKIEITPGVFNQNTQNRLMADIHATGKQADDLSGNGNGGVFSGGVTSSNPVPATAPAGAQSLYFDGTGTGVVTIKNSPSSLNPASEMTFAQWINQDWSVKPTKTAYYLDNTSVGSSGFYFARTNNNFTAGVRVDTPGSDGRFLTTLMASIPVSQLKDSAWSHVAATFDGTALKLYVNGVQAATSVTLPNKTNAKYPYAHRSDQVVHIGGRPAASSPNKIDENVVNGYIYDTKIYKEALTADEILALYKGTLPSSVSSFSTDRTEATVDYSVNGEAKQAQFSGLTKGIVNRRTATFVNSGRSQTLAWDVKVIDQMPFVMSAISEATATSPFYAKDVVAWTTTASTTSQIEYGTTTSYGTLTAPDQATQSHSVTLSNLKPATTYHYRVLLTDADGNKTITKDRTFTTAERPTTYYVGPAGTRDSQGTEMDPVGIQDILAKGAAQPGDTVILEGGTYNYLLNADGTPNPNGLVSNLTGTADKPIVFRAKTGDRVEIRSKIKILGAYATYEGLEFDQVGLNRISTVSGSQPTDLQALGAGGVNIDGPHVNFINNIVHDMVGNGIGFWSPSVDSAVSGNIIYNNGWVTKNDTIRDFGFRGPDGNFYAIHGHGIYSQNKDGKKLITGNIIFNNISGYNMHIYGSKAASLDNYLVADNVAFGGIFLIGGGAPSRNIEVAGNLLYGKGLSMGYSNTNNSDLNIHDNYIYAETPLDLLGGTDISVTHNTFVGMNGQSGISGSAVYLSAGQTSADLSQYFYQDNTYVQGRVQTPVNVFHAKTGVSTAYSWAQWQALGYDLSGVYRANANPWVSTRLTGVQTFVKPITSEPGRATVTVYNWDLNNTVNVALSASGLKTGDAYEIRDAQNYFGAPVAGGIFDAAHPVISISMTGTDVAQIAGDSTFLSTYAAQKKPHTSREFGTFIVLPTADTTPPAISAVSIPADKITASGGTIQWTTNEAGDSKIQFQDAKGRWTDAASDPTLVTNHALTLNNLLANTSYTYRVLSKDAAGNQAISTATTFMTGDNPPVAQDGFLSVNDNTKITGNVSGSDPDPNDPLTYAAQSQVSNGTLVFNTDGIFAYTATKHFSGTDSFTYNVTDSHGLASAAKTETFTVTDATPPTISGMDSSNITTSAVMITWTTDEPATTQIEYGLDTHYGNTTALDAALVTRHSSPVTGLSAGTVIHYRILSTDKNGNPTIGDDKTLMTVTDTSAVLDLTLPVAVGSLDQIQATPGVFNQTISNREMADMGVDSTSGLWMDYSGEGNNGTLNGGVTVTSDVPSTAPAGSKSFSFDGTSGYVAVPFSTSLVPSGAITFTAAINDSFATAPTHTEFYLNNTQWGAGGWYLSRDTGNNLTAGVRINSTVNGTLINYLTVKVSGKTLVNSNWNNVTAAFDGVTLKLYINGVLAATSITLPAPVAIHYPYSYKSPEMTIGGRPPADSSNKTANEFATGQIYGVGIYSTALSATDVAALAAGQNVPTAVSSFTTTSTDAKGYYSINGGAAQEVDFSGLQKGLNTLTLNLVDANGKKKTLEWSVTVVDQPPYTLSPVADASAANPFYAKDIVSFTTSADTTAQIQYGLDTNYGTTTTDASASSHAITLTNLKPSTTYHYRVILTDAFGNKTVSEDRVITTAERPTTYYVGPQGTYDSAGTQMDPVDIQDAFKAGAAQPGDTIKFVDGTYDYITTGLVSNLTGTAEKPITVIGGPDVHIEGGLLINGAFVNFLGNGTEISMGPNPDRISYTSGSAPKDLTALYTHRSVDIYGNNIKFNNFVVHDLPGGGINNWGGQSKVGSNNITQGNLVYNVGWISVGEDGTGDTVRTGGPTTLVNGIMSAVGMHGHGSYDQNNGLGQLTFDNNIFGYALSGLTMHAYSSSAGNLNNMIFKDNVSFLGRFMVGGNAPVRDTTLEGNLLYMSNLIGYGNTHNVNVSYLDNFVYNAGLKSGLAISLNGGENITVSGNTFIGGSGPAFTGGGLFGNAGGSIQLDQGQTVTDLSQYHFDGNTYIDQGAPNLVFTVSENKTGVSKTFTFAQWQAAGKDLTGTFINSLSITKPAPLTGVKIFVNPVGSEAGRANVTVYNFDLAKTVNIDLSTTGLVSGQTYKIHDAQNYYGPLVAGGIFDSNHPVINITMPGIEAQAAKLLGNLPDYFQQAHTSNQFGSFVIVPIAPVISSPTSPTVGTSSATIVTKKNNPLGDSAQSTSRNHDQVKSRDATGATIVTKKNNIKLTKPAAGPHIPPLGDSAQSTSRNHDQVKSRDARSNPGTSDHSAFTAHSKQPQDKIYSYNDPKPFPPPTGKIVSVTPVADAQIPVADRTSSNKAVVAVDTSGTTIVTKKNNGNTAAPADTQPPVTEPRIKLTGPAASTNKETSIQLSQPKKGLTHLADSKLNQPVTSTFRGDPARSTPKIPPSAFGVLRSISEWTSTDSLIETALNNLVVFGNSSNPLKKTLLQKISVLFRLAQQQMHQDGRRRGVPAERWGSTWGPDRADRPDRRPLRP